MALLTVGGDTIVSGVVEAINLLNTTVRTDLGVPVSIPNKARRSNWRQLLARQTQYSVSGRACANLRPTANAAP